jgi:acetoin utilization deacetylase AcuC-like enzyme
MTTLYATHPRCVEHEMPFGQHPERPERLSAVWQALDNAQLTARMQALIPAPCDRQWLAAVHEPDHLRLLEKTSQLDHAVLIDGDTYALPVSYEIARLAAGAVVETVDGVLRGTAANGLVVARPPGHHATESRPMGFCLLNNIAIGAAFALKQHGLERVLIVDYDVHHGNGTQDIFYEDERVFFISTHQYGRRFYPGTGALREMGNGRGHGYTLNVPLEGQQGDAAYAAVFEQIVWAAARRYQPQLILVSAGFDGHFVDPLANMQLSLSGYAHLTRELIRMAETVCGGKIVFVLEGGYDLTAVSHGVVNIAHALLGDATISDPLGLANQPEAPVQPLLDQIKHLHQL